MISRVLQVRETGEQPSTSDSFQSIDILLLTSLSFSPAVKKVCRVCCANLNPHQTVILLILLYYSLHLFHQDFSIIFLIVTFNIYASTSFFISANNLIISVRYIKQFPVFMLFTTRETNGRETYMNEYHLLVDQQQSTIRNNIRMGWWNFTQTYICSFSYFMATTTTHKTAAQENWKSNYARFYLL